VSENDQFLLLTKVADAITGIVTWKACENMTSDGMAVKVLSKVRGHFLSC
jgi:hypothetical protein